MPAVIGCSATLASIRSSASSSSATVTSHRSSQRLVDRPADDTDHHEGQAGQGVLRPAPRDWHPFVEGDLHRAAALGRVVALQLGEQCSGAEGFEGPRDVTLPAWRTSG